MGSGPSKITGLVHRLAFLRATVDMITGVTYRRFDDTVTTSGKED